MNLCSHIARSQNPEVKSLRNIHLKSQSKQNGGTVSCLDNKTQIVNIEDLAIFDVETDGKKAQ